MQGAFRGGKVHLRHRFIPVGAAKTPGHIRINLLPGKHYLLVGAGCEVVFCPDALWEEFRSVDMLVWRHSRRFEIKEGIGWVHHGNTAVWKPVGIREK